MKIVYCKDEQQKGGYTPTYPQSVMYYFQYVVAIISNKLIKASVEASLEQAHIISL